MISIVVFHPALRFAVFLLFLSLNQTIDKVAYHSKRFTLVSRKSAPSEVFYCTENILLPFISLICVQ